MFVVFRSAYFKKFMNVFERSFAIFTSRIMHLVCSHKILNFCITPVNVFFFSWNDCSTTEEIKNKGYAKLWGTNKVQYIMGADKQWMAEYSIFDILKFILGSKAWGNKTKEFIIEPQDDFFCFIPPSLMQPSMNVNILELVYLLLS